MPWVVATPKQRWRVCALLCEPNKKEWDEVSLVPVNSERRIVDAVRAGFEAEITFDVEPMKENIKLLAQLAEILEPFSPQIWETPHEKNAPNQSTILEKQAEVNELLAALLEIGISVFLGTYVSGQQVPQYDSEANCMYTNVYVPIEDVTKALGVISDAGDSHLMRKPNDVYQEDIDEIPF